MNIRTILTDEEHQTSKAQTLVKRDDDRKYRSLFEFAHIQKKIKVGQQQITMNK